MKKIIILFLSILFTNAIWSQISVYNSPANVEIGISYTYQFNFNSDILNGYNKYKIVSWQISSGTANMNNSGSHSFNDNSQAYTELSMGQTATISFPIKWEDNSANTSDIIYVNASVSYRNSVSGIWEYPIPYSFQTTTNGNTTLGYNVRVFRISTPTISTPTILACCSNNVQFTASNYGSADTFSWYNLSGCTIVSGQGTSTLIVTPDPAQGDVSVNCTVSRAAASILYQRTGSKTVLKTARTATYTTSPNYNYICKGSGRTTLINDQCGISSITWTAPNCTISSETIISGVRQRTITPNSSVVAGTSIVIYATVNFVGGCTAVTPSISFFIYDNATPPMPLGHIELRPAGYPDPYATFCPPSKIPPTFVINRYSDNDPINPGGIIDPNYNFVDGITTVTPAFIQTQTVTCANQSTYIPVKFNITVCNLNPCNGIKTCKVFPSYVPVCVQSCITKTNDNNQVKDLIITPNPTEGNFVLNLKDKKSGEYRIFNSYGFQVQEGKFLDERNINIKLNESFKSDIYLINVIIDNQIYSEKIILKK